jgi:hypothetical protein
VYPNAAGLDIGKEEILVAVPADRDEHPVRSYATFTPDLNALADWLQSCQIDTVAMESTGVYWIPIYELLEQRGIRCFLINAAHFKRVPGRKSDVQDCQWLQQCHSFGLLADSFRPDAEMVQLRTYLRHRAELIERRAPYILHMQKALHQMNLQLDVVLSNIMGDTGQAIIRSILQGERDPVKLAQLRHPNCHSSQETIAKALTGSYRENYLFALKQAVEFYDFYTTKITECDTQIERYFSTIKPRLPPLQPAPTARKKKNSNSRNEPASNTVMRRWANCGATNRTDKISAKRAESSNQPVISPSRLHLMFAALPHPKQRFPSAHHSSSINALRTGVRYLTSAVAVHVLPMLCEEGTYADEYSDRNVSL